MKIHSVKYYKYTDPTNGWLKVLNKTVKQLNIAMIISSNSYVSSGFVFLDQQHDMPIFIQAWEDRVGCQFPEIIIRESDTPTLIPTFQQYKPSRKEELMDSVIQRISKEAQELINNQIISNELFDNLIKCIDTAKKEPTFTNQNHVIDVYGEIVRVRDSAAGQQANLL